MVSKEKIKQFLNDNEIKEYSREKRKYPYKNGYFTVVKFMDKDSCCVAIILEELTQSIEEKLYKEFNNLYDNAYKFEHMEN